jgi:peptidoglycan/xylan/chitin deacetylase (PgdA/CDA1 family)
MLTLSLRSHARDRAARVLVRLPLRSALELLGKWPGVLVLTYHRIGDSEGQRWDHPMWSASAEELDEQLETLALCTEVIDPCDVQAAMSAGRGRRVLITFDDGYRDNYELAFPLLRRHRLSATFFLATGFLDRPRVAWWDEIAWMVRRAGDPTQRAADPRQRTGPTLSSDGTPEGASLLPDGISFAIPHQDTAIAALIARYKELPDGLGERLLEELAETVGSERCGTGEVEDLWMTWGMVRELHAAGMSIGGHTVTHPVLARLSPERQREELLACARRLSEEVGVAMRWFAYPVGTLDAFTPLTGQLLRECGVELAFSFYGGLARPAPRWDPFDVPRTHIGPALVPQLLGATLGLPSIRER